MKSVGLLRDGSISVILIRLYQGIRINDKTGADENTKAGNAFAG
jgi:hypothetical protein